MTVKKQKTTRSTTSKPKSPLKKATTKKVPKKVAAKSTPKKRESQKKPAKTPVKKSTRTTTPKKAESRTQTSTPAKKEPKKTETQVVLPRNMSIRSREKALVMAHEWKKAMHAMAYTSGMCFAVVGSALALLSMFGTTQSLAGQSALVAQTTEYVAPSGARPNLTTETSIPDEVIGDLNVVFSINDVSLVKAKLFKPGETRSYPDLELNNLLNNKYQVAIQSSSYPPGWYDLVVTYIPTNKQYSTTAQKIKTFHLGKITAATAELERPTADPVVNAPVTDPATLQDPFRIFTTQTELTGTVKVGLAAPISHSAIELYARPLNSLTPQFITLATERFGQKQFAFDSSSRLANGKYELYAQAKNSAGQSVNTKSVLVTISNKNPQITRPNTPTVPDTPENTSPVRLPADAKDREFAEVEFVRSETADTATQREVEALLEQNAESLKTLMQGYAVAKQSDDQVLIEAAKEALQEKRQSLVFEAMNDERVKDLADNIDENLKETFADLETRVDAFETIRKERSGGSTATDTDGDGVTDFDELNLYNTDPENADTDNDGFTDGAEIIRGFDPLDDEAEAIITYQSPNDSLAVVQSDLLSVESVTPLITTPEDPTKAVITGRGLPNSFVTLYIFSTPIVVTVKTDSDGSFVYTLDKELEDGAHEVFVALTDNTGSILSQSSPFSFVKQAQAFTPVDASDSEVVSNEGVVESSSQNVYNTVAGIGILALGIILIMLGVSLRSKDEEESDDEETEHLQAGRIGGTAASADPVIVKGKKIEHIDAT